MSTRSLQREEGTANERNLRSSGGERPVAERCSWIKERKMIVPLRSEEDALILLDQRRLPSEEIWLKISSWEGVAEAIRTMHRMFHPIFAENS